MKPELLMPAGDFEKAKIAYQFGADACYGSTNAFSMRTGEIGFDYKTLKKAIDYAHLIKKKFYITCNVYPHQFELKDIKIHIKKLVLMQPDALIIADPGVLKIATKELKSLRGGTTTVSLVASKKRSGKQSITKTEIHLSTQANTTNSESIKFWHKLGVKRFILARELSLAEITEIRKNVPKSVKLETFVHGSMCNSISGRCNLSNYLTYRDANRGACTQPCRWKYTLIEEKRPDQYIPVVEDENGSYIYNSKDLNMIEHLDKLADAGIDSFKVEGRNKSIYYCAIVARAYRKMIDNLRLDIAPAHSVIARSRQLAKTKQSNKIAAPSGLAMTNSETMKQQYNNELSTVTNRGYSTGYYFGKPTDADICYKTSRPSSDWQFVGIVKDSIERDIHPTSFRFSSNPTGSQLNPHCAGHSRSISQSASGGKHRKNINQPINPSTSLPSTSFGTGRAGKSTNHYLIECRNEIKKNTWVEIVTPYKIYRVKLSKLISPEGILYNKVNPGYEFVISCKHHLPVNSVIRKKI